MVTVTERLLRNPLKFETTREVYSKEGWAQTEGVLILQNDDSEVGAPQVELNGAVGEALITNPPQQCERTKLIFDVRIDNPFLD